MSVNSIKKMCGKSKLSKQSLQFSNKDDGTFQFDSTDTLESTSTAGSKECAIFPVYSGGADSTVERLIIDTGAADNILQIRGNLELAGIKNHGNGSGDIFLDHGSSGQLVLKDNSVEYLHMELDNGNDAAKISSQPSVNSINLVSETVAITGAATVSGESTLASAIISDLTANRVVLAGTDGAVEDSANLTFNGSTLAVTGAATVSGESTLASATISDLTSGRVVLAGTAGAVEDGGNLTFNGITLAVTGSATVSNALGVSGESTLASATISDLTSGRVVLAGTAGAVEDSGNLTFNGTTLAVTGSATVSNALGVSGESTLASATISDLTANRVVLAGTDGAVEDSANLTFNGSTLAVTGAATVSGESTLASATISDLTANRVVLAGTDGAVEDSANLTFNGSILAVTGAATVSSTPAVNGNCTLGDANSDSHTVNGSLSISNNLTVNGTTTTINSSSVTIDDAILTLGQPSGADSKYGIEFGEDGGALISDLSGGEGPVLKFQSAADGGGITNLAVNFETTLASATISDLTANRVVLAGTDGAVEDSANLTFNGSTLAVTGAATVSGESTLASATISDLTANRVVLAGTDGAVEDSANLTFNGSTLAVTGAATVSGESTLASVNY